MPTLTYYQRNQPEITVQQDSGKTLLETSLAHQLSHYHVCGGQARCTTCRVWVVNGLHNLSGHTPQEQEIAQRKNWPPQMRLACQARLLGDVSIKRLVADNADVDMVFAETGCAELGKEQALAVLFCDIANFTPFSANNLPYDVIHLLNRWYKEIGDPILAHQGYIDKYMGDGLLAWFGLKQPDAAANCLNAARAALQMLRRVEAFNSYVEQQFGQPLAVRIGVHYGTVIVGEIGHPQRRQLTVIGDAVNIASRIESANKELGTRLLVSEAVYAPIQAEVTIGQSARVKLRGQPGEHLLYQITGLAGEIV
jgi:adenylate cyclase